MNTDCLFVPDPRRCHCCRFDRATWITLAMAPEAVSNSVSQVLSAYIAPDNQTHVDFFIGLLKSWPVSDTIICYCHTQSSRHLTLCLNFLFRRATGNYAHIPNHLLSCTCVPEEIKSQLTEKREAHQMLKHLLPKGSQKQFFEAIWERLHSNNTHALLSE